MPTAEEYKAQLAVISKMFTDRHLPVPRVRIGEATAENWKDWRFKFIEEMRYYQLLYLIENEPDASVQEDANFKKLNQTAIGQLDINIGFALREIVITEPTVYGMFNKVVAHFEGSGEQRCISALQNIHKLITDKCEDLELIVSTIKQAKAIFDQHKDDKDLIWRAILISALPAKHHSLRTHLTQMEEADGTIKLRKFFNAAMIENRNADDEPKSMLMNNINKTLVCDYCQKEGHKKSDCRKLKRDLKSQRNDPKQQGGIKSNDHTNRSKPTSKSSARRNQTANLNTVQPPSNTLNESTEPENNYFNAAISCNYISKRDRIYLDSGATDHMFNSMVNTSDFVPQISSISTATGDMFPIKGRASIMIFSNSKCKIKLTEVVICEQLSANFISVPKLCEKGFKVQFESDRADVFRGNVLVMQALKRQDGLYEVITENSSISSISHQSAIVETHRKLGHLSLDYMRSMQDKLKLNIPTTFKLECDVCSESKIKRSPFIKKHVLSEQKLEYVHADLAGPINISNINNFKYFLLLSEESTKMMFVYLLKDKTETYQHFIHFKNTVENATSAKIKYLKSDNGREFSNKDFSQLQTSTGIQQIFSAPRCPSQNGAAERSIGVIKEKARCLLNDAKISFGFWPYAVTHAVYLKNRTPHSSIQMQIPYEKFYDKPIDLSNLVRFGQEIVYLRDDEDTHCFQAKGRKGRYLGNPYGYQAYLIYCFDRKRTYIRRHVKFVSDVVNEEQSDIEKQAIDEASDRYLTEAEIENHPPQQAVATTQEREVDQSDRPQSGTTINLNRTQLQHFKNRFQGVDLTRVGPVNTKQPGKVSSYLINSVTIPKNQRQMKAHPDTVKWQRAEKEEEAQFEKLNVLQQVKRPMNKQVLPLSWLYKVKYTTDGQIERYKARLIVQGHLQHKKENEEVFAPVLHELSLKSLIAFAVSNSYYIEHVDVCTAYLHADIEGEVYVRWPGDRNRVFKLLKSVYGLRSSARSFYLKMKQVLTHLQFKRSSVDPCVFYSNINSNPMIVGVYVDDLVVISENNELLSNFKVDLNSQITITDRGTLSQFLNINFTYDHDEGILSMNQTEYIQQTLELFQMADVNIKKSPIPSGAILYESHGKPLEDASEYLSLVGRLIYLAVHTRPDISFITSRLCSFMSNPTDYQLTLAKHVLKYLKFTADYSIYYVSNCNTQFKVYADADFANILSDSRSVSGLCVLFNNNLVTWSSRKQGQVAQFTCESEVRSMVDALNEFMYVNDLLNEIVDVQFRCVIYNDNQAAVKTANNGGDFNKNKAYRILVQKLRDKIEDKKLIIQHLPGEEMPADLLTKQLSSNRILKLLHLINIF